MGLHRLVNGASRRRSHGRLMTARQFIAVLACGGWSGFGLARSTMVSPEVVLSFPRWKDFGLMLVMGGAVAVTLAVCRGAPRLLASVASRP